MKISDTIIKNLGLSFSEYVYLHLLLYNYDRVENDEELQSKFSKELTSLQEKQLLKITPNKIVFRSKVLEIFEKANDIESWIDRFRKKFKGLRDRTPMGDRNRCIKNMKWFISSYPEYSVDDILVAADRYINQRRAEGLSIRQADFFIKKYVVEDGERLLVSDLLTTLEDIESLDDNNNSVGGESSSIYEVVYAKDN